MENYMVHGKELLAKGLKELNLELSDKQQNQFMDYFYMLIETNKAMNLTSIVDEDEVMVKHFIDSLLIVKFVDLNKFGSMIDVGTGAGFPGIPIKIMFPHIKVTLLDSLNKRLKFLNEVIEKLGLENISTIHGRAEDLGHKKEYRQNYDLCVSRAVANLSTLSEYCIPFIKINGIFASYKALGNAEETDEAKKAISILGAKIDREDAFELPCSDMKRKIVCIKKEKETPKKFPRKAGTPSKEPIR